MIIAEIWNDALETRANLSIVQATITAMTNKFVKTIFASMSNVGIVNIARTNKFVEDKNTIILASPSIALLMRIAKIFKEEL